MSAKANKKLSVEQAQKKIPKELASGMTPLNSKTFKLFLQEKLTQREAREVSKLVDIRLGYIVYMIHLMQGSQVEWFDFDNEGGENRRGYFDVLSYAEETCYTGQFKLNVDLYEMYFPTLWFDNAFEEELQKEIEEDGVNEEQREEKKVARMQELKKKQDALWKKLSAEERQLVKKISANEIESIVEKELG